MLGAQRPAVTDRSIVSCPKCQQSTTARRLPLADAAPGVEYYCCTPCNYLWGPRAAEGALQGASRLPATLT